MVYRQPSLDGVLSQTHKFPEVDPQDVPLDTPLRKLPRSTFQPSYAAAPSVFRDIVGPRTPAWPTFDASSWPVQHEEVETLLYLERESFPDGLAEMWRTQILRPGLLVRHRRGDWFFCFGRVLSAAVLWPAVSEKIRFVTLFGLDLRESLRLSDIRLLPVCDFEEWQCQPVRPVSPLHVSLLLKGRAPTKPTRWFLRSGTPEVHVVAACPLCRSSRAARPDPRPSCASVAFWPLQPPRPPRLD